MAEAADETLKRLWSIAAGWRTYDHDAAENRLRTLVAEGRVPHNDLRYFEAARAAFRAVLNAVRPSPLPGVIALWAASDVLRRHAIDFHGLDGKYQRELAHWLDACADQLQDAGDDEAAAPQEVRTALGIARALLGEDDPVPAADAGTETVTTTTTTEPNAALYFCCPSGHPQAIRTTTAAEGERRTQHLEVVCPQCEQDGTTGLLYLGKVGADG